MRVLFNLKCKNQTFFLCCGATKTLSDSNRYFLKLRFKKKKLRGYYRLTSSQSFGFVILMNIGDCVGIDAARSCSSFKRSRAFLELLRRVFLPRSPEVLSEVLGGSRRFGNMQLLIGTSQLLLALVLQVAPAQVNIISQTHQL